MQNYYTLYSFLNYIVCICVYICTALKENQHKQALKSEIREFYSTCLYH